MSRCTYYAGCDRPARLQTFSDGSSGLYCDNHGPSLFRRTLAAAASAEELVAAGLSHEEALDELARRGEVGS